MSSPDSLFLPAICRRCPFASSGNRCRHMLGSQTHRELGAGVSGHSDFFDAPFDRINRSVPQIWATIFESDRDARGRRIRDLHRDIKGWTGSAAGITH